MPELNHALFGRMANAIEAEPHRWDQLLWASWLLPNGTYEPAIDEYREKVGIMNRLNRDLFAKVTDAIEAEPDRWDQCDTVFGIAGWAVNCDWIGG